MTEGRRGRRVARAAAAVLLAGAMGGCALLRGRPEESPEDVRARTERDLGIQREVEARLAAEPSIGPGRIRVAVLRGDVSLHGGVAGYAAARCAIRTAELATGARLVVDFLEVEPGPREVRCLAPRHWPA